jgi:hypothetical protein
MAWIGLFPPTQTLKEWLRIAVGHSFFFEIGFVPALLHTHLIQLYQDFINEIGIIIEMNN